MISMRIGGVRFDLRAAAVVLDGPRVLLHRPGRDAAWSLPGGRVEAGEEGASAVVREMQEELGEPVTVERHLWTIENFYAHGGESIHELGLYFQCGLAPGSRLLAQPGPFEGDEAGRPLQFAWFDRFGLAGVPVLPPTLVPLLAMPVLATCHQAVKGRPHHA